MQNSFAALKIDTWNTQAGTKVFFVENHDLPILDININFLHLILKRWYYAGRGWIYLIILIFFIYFFQKYFKKKK